MDYKWYFAYGSNLYRKRLKERIEKWKDERKATLKGFRLTFAKGSKEHTSGKANIKPDPNGEVKGVIYLVTEDQLKKLDKCEGVRDNRGVYKRELVEVESEGQRVLAETYVMVEEKCPLKPSEEYLNFILKGLEEHGYSKEDIEEVRRIAESMPEICTKDPPVG